MNLKIGGKFDHELMTWKVIDRFENYILVESLPRRGQVKCWTATNVKTRNEREFAEPYIKSVEPGSICLDKERMVQFFNSEVEKLKARQATKAKSEKFQNDEREKLDKWSVRCAAAKGIHDSLVSRFKAVCNGQEPEEIMQSKELQNITAQLRVIETYLKFNKQY